MDLHVPSKIKNVCGFVLIWMNLYMSCCNEGTHHEIDCLMHFILNRKSKNYIKQDEIIESDIEEESENNQLQENFMCSLSDIISDITPNGNVIWLDTRDKKIHQIASTKKSVEPPVDAVADKTDNSKTSLKENKATLPNQQLEPPQNKRLIEDKPGPQEIPFTPKLTASSTKSQSSTKQQGQSKPKPMEKEIPLKPETPILEATETKNVEVEIVLPKSPEKSQDAKIENVEHISEEPEIKSNSKIVGDHHYESGYQSTNNDSSIHSDSQSIDSSLVQNDLKEVANSTRNHEDEMENANADEDAIENEDTNEGRFMGFRLSTVMTATATVLLGVLLI